MACRSPQTTSKHVRLFILIACFLECVVFGGTYFGWASMAFVLKGDGVYGYLCQEPSHNGSDLYKDEHSGDINIHNNSGTEYKFLQDRNGTSQGSDGMECPAQDSKLSLAFTIGLVLFVLSFPLGWMFDRFGLLVMRCISWILAMVGFGCLALAHGEISWLIFPGCGCVGVSCNILIMTNCHICGLAGKRTSTCIALYSGGLGAATVIFLLFKLSYEAGLSRTYIVAFYMALWIVVPIMSFSVIPWYKVTSPISYNNNKSESSRPASVTEKLEKYGTTKEQKGESAQSLVFSPMYIILVMWYTILHVRVGAFISLFNGWISHLVEDDASKVSQYMNVYGIIQICGSVLAPMSGILIDWRRKKLEGENLIGTFRSVMTLPSVLITSVAAILTSSVILLHTESIIYLTFVSSEVMRNFTYATTLAFIEICYPAKHYGVLFGAAYSSIGLFSLLQIPYVLWARHSGFFLVHLWLLACALLTLLLPASILIKRFYGKKGASNAAFKQSKQPTESDKFLEM